jgi:hypothetical protein
MKGLKLANPLILSGSNGINVFPTLIDNRADVTASIFTEQDITTTGSVTFNTTDINGTVNVANNKWIIDPLYPGVRLRVSASLDAIGNLGALNLSTPLSMSVDNNLTFSELQTSHTSSSIIYPSGSRKFGDTPDDKHLVSGSMILSSSAFGFGKNSIDGFANDKFGTNSSQTNPITEYAGRNIIATWEQNQLYLRNQYAKLGTIVTRTTASFNATTASAPSEQNSIYTHLTSTSKNDFMFFKNGMIMEPDALNIKQSGSFMYLMISPDSLGYDLASTDEIVAWGKFNP